MDVSDVDRFYKSKGVASNCGTCGRSEWIVADAPDNQTNWALTSARTDGGTYMPAPSVPVLTLMCAHCFSLRLHALIPLKKWLDENPKG